MDRVPALYGRRAFPTQPRLLDVLSLPTSGPQSPGPSPGSAPHDVDGHRLLPPGMSGPLLGSVLYPGLCVCELAKKDAPLSN